MEIRKIFGLFFLWRLYLIAVLLFATAFIPLGSNDRFLGGGAVNFNQHPYLFSWANYDGEHYLSIATYGYRSLQHAFFPFYPLLIYIFSQAASLNLQPPLLLSTVWGIVISNVSILLALVMLVKLVKLDFSDKTALWSVVLLLTFPVSYYFGAVYTESLFLLLAVSSFYLARKKRWFLASVLGGMAAATRIFGVFLFPSLLIEAYLQKQKKPQMLWLLLIPAGFGLYLYYQWVTTGDPMAFFKAQKLVGEQHESNFVLLPQVFYRYLKMLATTDINNPIFQTLVLELVSGILFLVLPVYGYIKRIRVSYLFFAMAGYFISVIQGSFVSLPRYGLVFFPIFIAAAIFTGGFSKLPKIFLVTLSMFWLALETVLFLRGYWVS